MLIENARTRDERAERLSNISLHHRHICEMVSIFLDVSVDDVVDSVIDTKLSMAAMDSFLEKDTRDMSVLFYLQHESPRLSSQSRFDNQFDPHHRKVQLSGHPVILSDKSVVVYKTENVAVSLKNVGENGLCDSCYTDFDILTLLRLNSLELLTVTTLGEVPIL
ncbi:hypothetical protein HHI36_015054 [Cryptolaemus montrouzieri]|uniref:Uncharacterized protein n=1 Tax=Cryptolaemus montrouzieri TaxID=559131 RepID=A0ABD2N4Z3_9CUCU